MKLFKSFIVACTLIFLVAACGTNSKSGKKLTLKSNQDSVSYVIGAQMAQSLKQIKGEINVDLLISALRTQLEADSMQIDPAKAQSIMREFSNKIRTQEQEKRKLLAQTNLDAGAKFLQENKTKEGVVTTESGLQYIVLQQGNGPKPTPENKVKVHYQGTTIDGKEFDSSFKRGEPATFQVSGVIKGWTEALTLMNVGSKYKLFIPSELAYGARGNQNIEPNSVLIFEVELLSIEG